MSRISRDHYDFKPAHPETQDSLFDVTRRLKLALADGGKPDASTRQDCINALSSARRELEQCTESPEIMYLRDIHDIAEMKMSKHSDLILWITEVSIALKLQDIELSEPHRQLTVAMVERGNRLILDLENCRKRVRWD